MPSTYSIRLRRAWEPRRAHKHFPAGTYKVPADIPADLAELALDRGIAERVTRKGKAK